MLHCRFLILDSGEEGDETINNMPGSLLRAPDYLVLDDSFGANSDTYLNLVLRQTGLHLLLVIRNNHFQQRKESLLQSCVQMEKNQI
ncbi:hypothetical protein TNCV_898651 [Trichonephila clavipes]|nr:hypothetical protein TNCV_898651 [Trichonephila clavipes]